MQDFKHEFYAITCWRSELAKRLLPVEAPTYEDAFRAAHRFLGKELHSVVTPSGMKGTKIEHYPVDMTLVIK